MSTFNTVVDAEYPVGKVIDVLYGLFLNVVVGLTFVIGIFFYSGIDNFLNQFYDDKGLSADVREDNLINGIMQDGALGNSQYPDTHQAFTSGKAAMMTMGTWNNFSTFTNEGLKGSKDSYGFSEDFKYGITGLPDMNGDGILNVMDVILIVSLIIG